MRDFVASYGLELMLLICSVFIIWVGLRSKKSLIKHLFFNISAIFIVLFILELYLTIDNIPQSKIEYQEPYYTTNPELGYGVSDSSFSARATKSWIKSGEEIYDAYYSFADGRRVTPGSDTTSQRYSIFLGGSFTFGEGIHDTETLPYYYNQLYSQKRNIRNYGFHGYGTHQVYTIAKNHLATDSALHASENVEIFYWFIDPHILRANGYSPWDRKSIRYIVENGKLKHTGTFDEQKNTHSLVMKYWKFVWTNSGIFKRLRPRLVTGEEELELVFQLIRETDQLLKKQGFKFTVLVQNTSGSDRLFGAHFKNVRKRVVQHLEEQDIEFIHVNEALLKGIRGSGLLHISGDGHPTGEFNRRLADFLWKNNKTNRDSEGKN